MSDLLEFLNSHASVRSFEPREISPEDEQTICATAERSPTSSNLHAYSIISVRNQESKAELAKLCGGQDHVATCPLFLVFCADLYRLRSLCEARGYDSHHGTAEMLLIATIDAALAGGRALMAAQALGIGGVMVGGIRNDPEPVCDLLALPRLVYPIMGMSLGYPARSPKAKPRLPLEGIVFQEKYNNEAIADAVAAYDQTIDSVGYLKRRPLEPENYPSFEGLYSWSEHSARRMASDAPGAKRFHMLKFLQDRGFLQE